jgi:hypothetical protein
VLPWVSTFLETAEFPGGWKFQFRELKAEQQRQKAEIESLRFLMSYFVTDYELIHLRKLAGGEPFPYTKNDSFLAELRRLRTLRLIDNLPGRGIRALPGQGDLREHFTITDRGRSYLQLRTQWESDLPMED